MSVAWYQDHQASHAMSTSVLKALPGKFDINGHEPGILFIRQEFTHCFTLQISDYNVIFDICVDSASLATSLKSATSS